MALCSTCCEQDVACSGVPSNNADSFGVSLQNHHRVRKRAGQCMIRDLPHLKSTTARLIGLYVKKLFKIFFVFFKLINNH